MVIEQLTIFDEFEEEDERKIMLVRSVMSDDWSYKTNKKGIIYSDKVEFSKLELLNLISVATSIKKETYGHNVYFVEDGINYSVFIRFVNYKTKAKVTAVEYVKQYFSILPAWAYCNYLENDKK